MPQEDELDVQNIDYVLRNFKKKVCLIFEVKHYGALPGYGQKETYRLIHKALTLSCPKLGWTYKGCHLVRFDGQGFPGEPFCWFDGEKLTEDGLRERLCSLLEFETEKPLTLEDVFGSN